MNNNSGIANITKLSSKKILRRTNLGNTNKRISNQLKQVKQSIQNSNPIVNTISNNNQNVIRNSVRSGLRSTLTNMDSSNEDPDYPPRVAEFKTFIGTVGATKKSSVLNKNKSSKNKTGKTKNKQQSINELNNGKTQRIKTLLPTKCDFMPQPQENKKKENYTKMYKEKKIHPSGKIWGLGVEHEFIVVVDDANTAAKSIKLCNTFMTEKLDEKNTEIIKRLFSKKHKPKFVLPFLGKATKLPYIDGNVESTSKNHIYMLEIKNLDYYNSSLKDVVKELNCQQSETFETLEKELKDEHKINVKLSDSNVGANKFLFFKHGKYSAYRLNNSGIIGQKNNTLTYKTDYSGSYHFWITLPTLPDDKNKVEYHKNAMFLLQTMEPIFCSLFSSCDPNLAKDPKRIAGSYRSVMNFWANFGVGKIYDETKLSSRVNSTPAVYNNSKFYLFQLLDYYKNKKTNNNINNNLINNDDKINELEYFLLKDKTNDIVYSLYEAGQWSYARLYKEMNDHGIKELGSDFRKTNGVDGFEFRIWDHFPQKYLPDVLKIVYLIASYSFNIGLDNKHFKYSGIEAPWNNNMTQAMINGYKFKPSEDYVNFINQQFNFKGKSKLKYTSNITPKKLLLNLIDSLLLKVKNKNHEFWLLAGDTPSTFKKPTIHNINKMSQDYAMI
jgi:hypothetical protein